MINKNYELSEFGECLRQNFAAKTANVYELGFGHSYQFATKLQNSIDFVECKAFRENPYHS